MPVSIGLPVRNGAAHLREALEGLLAQTFTDVEILVSDNASTDETPDIIADLARRDARIRWWRLPEDRGAAHNYNEVFRQAEGGLFKWASHDDLCAPTFVERCVHELGRAGPEVVLAYPQTDLIDGEGRSLGPFDDRLDLRSPTAARRLRDYAMRWRLVNVLFGVMRSDVLARTGLIRPRISSDLTLVAELALRGRFHEVPERLFSRRVHVGSSRGGDRSLEEVSAWFDPGGTTRRRVPPLVAVWGSTIHAIAAADDVPLARRAVCAGVYAESWAEKRARVRVGRVRQGLRHTRPTLDPVR